MLEHQPGGSNVAFNNNAQTNNANGLNLVSVGNPVVTQASPGSNMIYNGQHQTNSK